jgi:hypothetical protein
MPTFPAFTVTAAGLDMQAQAVLGGTLTFTRIALGAGAAANPATALALVDQRMTSDIQQFTNMGGGNARLRAAFSNSALATGFGMSEVGVFALDPTTNAERLHSYSKTTTPDYMPAMSGPALVEQIFDAIIAIGSAASVTAAINDTVMIATKEDTFLPMMPRVTVGAGGASAVDLVCASAGYDEISILMQGLFKQGNKAYLQADLADGPQEAIVLNESGAMVGYRTSRVWLARALASPMLVGETSGAGISNLSGVAVSGNYAYITSGSQNCLRVVDISNPTAPSIVATLSGLTGAGYVAVSGTKAYVTSSSGAYLKVVDISTPTSPAVVGTLSTLTAAGRVAVSGSYAYVVSATGGTLRVIDVSVSTTPSLVGTLSGLTSPYDVAISGNYAYVVNSNSTTMNIINVTTKASPALVGTATGLNSPLGVAVSGNYAYVTNSGTTTMSIIDISTPASPVVVGTATGLTSPADIAVSGNYAYVVSSNGAHLKVIDVSTYSSPVVVGTLATGLTLPYQIAVSGGYAYVVNSNSTTIAVIDISTPTGGKLSMWRGGSTGMQYELTMVTATGRSVFKASGCLPAWTTKLTIASTLTGGLLEGGKILIRGRKLAP